MIISLCEKCSEGCSHCFINSLPRSPIMTSETLEQTKTFVSRLSTPMFLISGGEFTEHPEFEFYVTSILESAKGKRVGLLSNGSWFFCEEKKEAVKRLANHPQVEFIQIRTHKKYYPNYKRTWESRNEIHAFHPKIDMYDDGIVVFPLGRARANHKESITENPRSPMCANLFLLARQGAVRNFDDLVTTLTLRGKLCKPFVSSYGNIHAGETPYCTNLGHITDNDDDIFKRVLKKKPNNTCGKMKNLPIPAKQFFPEFKGGLI